MNNRRRSTSPQSNRCRFEGGRGRPAGGGVYGKGGTIVSPAVDCQGTPQRSPPESATIIGTGTGNTSSFRGKKRMGSLLVLWPSVQPRILLILFLCPTSHDVIPMTQYEIMQYYIRRLLLLLTAMLNTHFQTQSAIIHNL